MWRWGRTLNLSGCGELMNGPSEVCGIRKWIGLAAWMPPYPFKGEIASCREAFCSRSGQRAGCFSPVLCFSFFLFFFFLKKKTPSLF